MTTTTQNNAKDEPAVPAHIELRDYFAARDPKACDESDAAAAAYLIADSMLAAREGK